MPADPAKAQAHRDWAQAKGLRLIEMGVLPPNPGEGRQYPWTCGQGHVVEGPGDERIAKGKDRTFFKCLVCARAYNNKRERALRARRKDSQ